MTDINVKNEADLHFFSTDLYIMSAAIVGSILLYPAGGLAYIDALFFASGAATQSGLNTYKSYFGCLGLPTDGMAGLMSMTSIHINRQVRSIPCTS